mgnify:CR=1 FL=1
MLLRETLSLSLVGLTSHKLRSLLTMLGIIFGVASVIAMLSIGEGAKQEALQQIRQMGISNIIVQHWDDSEDDDDEGASNEDANLSQGLSRADAASIKEICILAKVVTPQREVKVKAQRLGVDFRTMVVGTTPEYLDVLSASTSRGVFLTHDDLSQARRVCVLGSDAKRALFFFEGAIGKQIKMRNN